jgi:hypothetical protein
MTGSPSSERRALEDHQTWVHSRLLLDKGFQDAVQHGFALIASGFGSFALFDGLAGVGGHGALPKTFALALTAVGVIMIGLAANHNRKMITWVNADEFGVEPAPALPDENRPRYLAAGAIVIGFISFIALLLLPS